MRYLHYREKKSIEMKKKDQKFHVVYFTAAIKLKIPNTDANQLLMNYLNKSNEYSDMLQSVVQ